MQTIEAAPGVTLFTLTEPVPDGVVDRDEPILLIHGFASSHAVNWVLPLWAKTLTAAGRRTILYDVRGHGRSTKLYDPRDYTIDVLADEALAVMDRLALDCIDVMGYSMGARIGAFLQRRAPERLRSLVLGGLGYSLVEGGTLPTSIADAMDAPALESLTDPHQRLFRAFADATRSDRRALAACIRGARQMMPLHEVRQISCPVLVAVGSHDDIAGDPEALAELIPQARVLHIEGRDHNRAVGDKAYKEAVLAFLDERE